MLKQIQKARKIFSFGCQYPKSFSPYIVDSLLPFDNWYKFQHTLCIYNSEAVTQSNAHIQTKEILKLGHILERQSFELGFLN